ncbi:MAG: DUF4367 domain-containing protein [Chloroflexota bacterium]|nr:DUF4367 domain-containing protein [Chloroflexota bacterium]
MNKRRFVGTSLIALALLLSLFLSGCQRGPTAEEIVAKMQEVEASIEDAHAVLEVSIHGQGMEAEVVAEVWEKRPDKFRAEVLEASEAELVGAITVTNGDQAWMYDPTENEVVVGKLETGEPSSPREMIQFVEGIVQRVSDTSEVKLVGEEKINGVATYRLEFTPQTDAQETLLPPGSVATLWVEQERWIALQAHLASDIVGEGWLRVRSFEFNTGIADERFQFEVPEGARVTEAEDKQAVPLTLDEALERAEFRLLVPTYVPEEATLIDVFTLEGAFIFHYDHASAVSFTIVQRPKDDRSQPLPGKEVTVRGQIGFLISDGPDNSFLTWTERNVYIHIAGNISPEEALKVAESLQ